MVQRLGAAAVEKTTVSVKIMGENFLITGTQPEELVVSLAKELDVKLAEARKLMPSASANRVAISVALGLLAEMRTEKEKSAALLKAFERS